MMVIQTIEGTHAYVLPGEVAAIVGIKDRDDASHIYLKGGASIAVAVGPDKMAGMWKQAMGQLGG